MAIPCCSMRIPKRKATDFRHARWWATPRMAWLRVAVFFLFSMVAAQAQEQILENKITIQKQQTTLYDALNIISDKAGCLFIYDSQVVESDKRVKMEANNQPVRQVLDRLLQNPELGYKVIGSHILICRKAKQPDLATKPPLTEAPADSIKTIVIKGHIFDNVNKNPVPYATIGIQEENIGTVTNTDGYFVLKIPAGFSGSELLVSHIGYLSQDIPIQLLAEQQVDIYLDQRIISLQEVMIRYIDPNFLVAKAVEQRKANNSLEPVYMTTFYREGVLKNDHILNYSEAVFKVYKSSVELSEHSDQVKMLKSRKIQNTSQKDTVFLKLKAGVLTGLQLDIVKVLPSFLDVAQSSSYTFTYSNMVSYNSQDAYTVTFVQKEGIEEALFSGTLYIGKENYAILGADFEINPGYLHLAANDLILRKSRKLIVKLEKISYSVNYTPYNGKHYLNHVRCDMRLKTRLRNRLKYDNFATFLEIATCNIDTVNVTKFAKQEVIKPDVVFSDTPFVYDEAFWDGYNIIAPEEKLNEALSKIIAKIEKIE